MTAPTTAAPAPTCPTAPTGPTDPTATAAPGATTGPAASGAHAGSPDAPATTTGPRLGRPAARRGSTPRRGRPGNLLLWSRTAPAWSSLRARLRGVRALGAEAGMATAEYAIATLAAVGFAGLLLVILRGDEVRGMLTDLVRQALQQ